MPGPSQGRSRALAARSQAAQRPRTRLAEIPDGVSEHTPGQAVSDEARLAGAGLLLPHLPAGNVAPSLCLRPGPQESSYLREHH